MHLNNDEVTLIYNGTHERDRKTLACALSLNRPVNKQDITTVRVSQTLFEFMMEHLGDKGRDILNKSDPYYQEHMKGKRLTNSEYLEYLRRNPDLLRAPIAMFKNKVVVCNTPTDIYKVLT